MLESVLTVGNTAVANFTESLAFTRLLNSAIKLSTHMVQLVGPDSSLQHGMPLNCAVADSCIAISHCNPENKATH